MDRPSGTPHYYYSDYLGSASKIVGITGSSAGVQEQYYYYPYGGTQSQIGSDPNHYKFTGKERDSESNLDNFGARYYGFTMGRFMTPDWAARPTSVPYAVFGDPQSLNLYGYVRNDPVSRADANGHCYFGNCDSSGYNDGPGSLIGAMNASMFTALSGSITYSSWLDQYDDPPWVLEEAAIEEAATPSEPKRQSNRQPDGSYKATPEQLAQIQKAADKKTTIGNGQCVTACERFTGVPGPTSLWEGGKPASELTDKDKGTAIATFVEGSDGKWRYLPDANGHMNSGTFMGTSTKGTFWMADQWPQGKPVSIWNVGSNPNNASMNAASYRVIIVQNP